VTHEQALLSEVAAPRQSALYWLGMVVVTPERYSKQNAAFSSAWTSLIRLR
jgi:hypothetical protein